MDVDEYIKKVHKNAAEISLTVLLLWLFLITLSNFFRAPQFYFFDYSAHLLPAIALGILLFGFLPKGRIKTKNMAIGGLAMFIPLVLALCYADKYSLAAYDLGGGPISYWILFPGIAAFLVTGLIGGFLAGLGYKTKDKMMSAEAISYGGLMLSMAFCMVLILSFIAGIIDMAGFCCNPLTWTFRTTNFLESFGLEVVFTLLFATAAGLILSQKTTEI